MLSHQTVSDGLGNPIKVIYSNGFCFEGEFTIDEIPSYGVIKDDKGNLVYEGTIEEDIYRYFQLYSETGKTIKSHRL